VLRAELTKWDWATLLQRVWGVDALTEPKNWSSVVLDGRTALEFLSPVDALTEPKNWSSVVLDGRTALEFLSPTMLEDPLPRPREHQGVQPRCTALRLAARDKLPGAKEQVLAALSDPDITIRAAATTALGWFDELWATDLLLGICADEPNDHLRGEAYWALVGSTDPRVLDAYLREIERPYRARRPLQAIASGLGDFNDPRALSALRVIAKVDDDMAASIARESIQKLLSHP
jgi:hypothetical protein